MPTRFRRRSRCSCALALLGALLCSAPAPAVWLVGERIDPPGDPAGDRFGEVVAGDGDTVLIVAGADRDLSPAGGAAIFLERDAQGVETRTKIPLDHLGVAASSSRVVSADIDGARAIVGAQDGLSRTPDSAGRVYLFERDADAGWRIDAALAPPTGAHRFGASVRIRGDRAFVGATDTVVRGVRTGAVFIYHRTDDGWILRQRLTAPEATPELGLGAALALTGDTLFVGAPGTNRAGGAARGVVHRFTALTPDGPWVWAGALDPVPLSQSTALRFGASLAAAGDRLLIGAPNDSADGPQAGSVFVAARDSAGAWRVRERIAAPVAESWGRFGAAVALRDGVATIGAPVSSSAEASRGAAFQYRLDPAGAIRTKTFLPDRDDRADFGRSVAALADGVVIGAPGDSRSASGAGAAQRVQIVGDLVPRSRVLLPDAVGGDSEDAFSGAFMAGAGDIAVVSAHGCDYLRNRLGAAHVYAFKDGAWQWRQRLHPWDAEREDRPAGENFGQGVATDGTRIAVVSAAWSGAAPVLVDAAVYIYTKAGDRWVPEQKIAMPPVARTVGASVALDGDWLLVGLPSRSFMGRARLYERTDAEGWTLRREFLPADGAEEFGWRVALDDDRLAIATLSKRVDLLRRVDDDSDEWADAGSVASMLNLTGFGSALAFAGDSLFVGELTHKTVGPGAVHAYSLSGAGPVLSEILQPPTGRIGRSIAVDGDRLVTGGLMHWIGVDRTGAVMSFRKVGGRWLPDGLVADPAGSLDTRFGEAAVFAHGVALISAPAATENGENAGSLYPLRRIELDGDLNDDGVVDGLDLGAMLVRWGARGATADLNGDSVVDGADLGILLRNWSPPEEI
jgi:hypothetical protein